MKVLWPRIIVFMSLAVFIIACLIINDIFSVPSIPAQREDGNYIYPQTMVRREVYYSACRHLDSHAATGQKEFVNKTFAEIAEDGWYVFWAEGGGAVAFRESGQLCPNDADKSHLALHQGKLAVFAGPIGTNGEPLEIISINPSALPSIWQQKLANGGIEFKSREELLSALESMDELKE